MANFKLSSVMDYISGTSGNDVIDETTTGNLNIYDYIDGGAGEDVIIIDESSTDFLDAIATLSFLGVDSKTAITTAYPSVKNIEKIQFTDVIYTLADGSVEPISTTKPSGNPITTPTNLKPATFAPQKTFAVGTQPMSVVVNDFNNDGKIDVATANMESNDISVLLGDGKAEFSTLGSFAVGTRPIFLNTAYFNKDGKVDLVSVNEKDNNISILLGDGKGNFGNQKTFAVGNQPESVNVGDFNDDGIADLVIANSKGNNVSILLGDGQGNFGTQTLFDVGSFPYSVSVSDLNGDKKDDLVTANFMGNNVSVLLGDGLGGFGKSTFFSAGTFPKYVSTGDLNGDKKVDLITANFDGDRKNSISVLLGDGLGNFNIQTVFAVGSNPYSTDIGDFNGDGNKDLVSTNANSNSISVLLGDSSGDFATQTVFYGGGNPLSVGIADFNSDNKTDLVVQDAVNNNIFVLLNTTEGTFIAPSKPVVIPEIEKPVIIKPVIPTTPKETILETKKPYFVGKDSNADNVIGSVIGDDISGNIGNDTLKGGDGDDTINGGNDNDQIFGEEGDDKLKGGAGNDSLDGGAGSDKLEGETGNDTLNGGLGSDDMIGGEGDDNYIIDNQNDKITEATNPQGGNDTASISIGLKWQNNFSRFAGVENFILTGDKQDEFDAAGDDNTNILTGNIGNNRLYGNGGNDTLIGNDGNDTLDGGAGIDLLQGGAGDDTYVVNNEEDIIEDNKGVDTIQSSETITLSKYPTVETLELTGSKSIKGTGNSNKNLIEGNDANNELNGKSGNDTLKGNGGDDTLIGDAGDDSLDGGDGEDTVRYDESQDSYATKSIDGIYNIINKATGETDQLTDVEFVEYSDATEKLGVSTTPLHLSIADISIQEGNKAGATNAKVVLTLDKPATDTFTVDLNTEDGTAFAGKDYKAVQKTITFNEGDKTVSVQIPIISDKVFEANENFSVHLDNLSLDSVELDNTDANVTILNDDKPSLSFAAVKITEGQKGKANAEISVTLSSAISQAVKVHYQTVDGTALKAKDYTATTGDLIIPANTKTAKISIPIIDDKLAESTETFTVKFSAPDYALLPNNASATVSILDNDSPILVTGTPS